MYKGSYCNTSAADVADVKSDSDEVVESDDDGKNNDSDGDDVKANDVGGDARRDITDSSDDANGGSDAEFNAAHKPLRGSFKTAEGISVSIVKGSIAAQKVCLMAFTVLLAADSIHFTALERRG